MATFTNAFAALSISVETSELSNNQPSKKKVGPKKKVPKVPKATTAFNLKEEMANFEYDHPVGAIFFHHKGKDRLLVFNFKFSHTFLNEFSGRSVKNITLSAIQKIMNDRPKKPNNVVVWESYFEKETLEKLIDQEYFEIPSEFKSTFDLVRGEPITHIGFSPVIIFDYRMTNSKQEFIYLPDGSRVYFGKTYDDFRVGKRERNLRSIMKHYENSLCHLDLEKVRKALDEIYRLTNDCPDRYADDRQFADKAERFIAKYVHLHNDDQQVELRNLLSFKNWPDDLKRQYEYALDYRDDLFNLLKIVKEEHENRKKASELKDETAYPSLC